MDKLGTSDRLLAASLAALAGFVDAVGFMELGGFFVSFMSGNTTRAAVGLAGHTGDALRAGALIGSFVVGVIAGSMTGHFAGSRRKPVVLVLVAAMLSAAALLDMTAFPFLAGAAMAFGMGAENAVFETEGEVRFGLTYMTGTLVKIGQRIATALRGGRPFAWAPYLLQWLALAGGAIAGAALHPWLGLGALWLAAGVALVLAAVCWFRWKNSAAA